MDFLDCPPSAIAAAAVLCATDQNVDHRELGYFHKRVSKVSLALQFALINILVADMAQVYSLSKLHLQATYFPANFYELTKTYNKWK